MRSLISTIVLSSSLLSVAALTGCMSKDAASDDSAESSVDSAESASAEGDVIMAATDDSEASTPGSLTAASVSAKVAANVTARHLPAGCATVTTSGTSIKAVYNDCTGPRGLVHVTGELDLNVAVSQQGAISVHGTATGFRVNGATLDIDATGTYTTTGTGHSLAVTSTGTGTGPRGRAIDHEGNYTINWDPSTQCHSIDGNWSTDIGAHTRANAVTLSRCAGGCPTGSVVHTFLGGKSLTITFDGSATAAWALSGGASGTVALSCQ